MNRPSLWTETASVQTFPRLAADTNADVVVVGGGIAGLTGALLLQRAGKRVVVLEAARVGHAETGHTTAHVTAVLDTRYHVLESKFGRDGARAAADSSRAAIDRIEALAREFGGCGFSRVPAYLYAEDDRQRHELDKELAAFRRVGLDAGSVDTVPLPLKVLAAVRIEQQAQFHPLEYLREMAARFVAAGGQIFEETRAIDIDDDHPCRVSTPSGVVTANHVLVTTNHPTSSKFAIHTKIAAYRTYAIAARLRGEFPAGLFWDMQDPYHYTRVQQTSAGTFLIVGGEDHKTGQKTDSDVCFRRLDDYTRALVPDAEIVHRWSGQIIEPSDGLPFIGHDGGAKHVYVATGFSGNGMTFGTLAGMILADEVLGTANPWAELYRATRIKPLAQAREFVAENVDFPTYLARDRLGPGQVSSAAEIPPSEGRLLRSGMKMLAVYRDESGGLHVRSAVCTHLGCNVRWNNAERTWDCPCHGSRFDVEGCVLNGPATKDLEAATLPEQGEHLGTSG